MLYTVSFFTDLKDIEARRKAEGLQVKSPPADVESGPSPDDLELNIFTSEGEPIGHFSIPSGYGVIAATGLDYARYEHDERPEPPEESQ